MASLLICGFDSFPAAPVNPAAAVIRRLSAQAWRAGDTDTGFLVTPVAWTGAVEAIQADLAKRPADAVLVVGVATKAQSFRVETLARNLACAVTLDAAGALWPHGAILPDGAETLDASAPCRAMAEAVAALGLPVESSCDAGDYLCNFTLYRLLAAGSAPRVGFLHVPQAWECAPGAAFDLEQIEAAVRASAGAMAAAILPALGAAR